MDNVFQKVFKNVIGIEGGYVNNPKDPGGETKYGISKRSYPTVDIKNLTLDGAQQIYWDDFWSKLKCDRMNPQLAEFVFDFAVNSGTGTAAKAIQRAVGALPDGAIGPRTLELLTGKSPRHVVRLVFVDRFKVMAEAPAYEDSKNGWGARLFDVLARYFDEGGV
jgi:lysozyme family protein